MQTMLKATRPRYSRERFQAGLKNLMKERHLSYRQLAYKTQLSAGYLNHLAKGTRPVPADPVIRIIATALRVEADFFLEYRLRQVAGVLERLGPVDRRALRRAAAAHTRLRRHEDDARKARQRRFALAQRRGLTTSDT
jgi:transcriptional regulator with XRE-family HTH domain